MLREMHVGRNAKRFGGFRDVPKDEFLDTYKLISSDKMDEIMRMQINGFVSWMMRKSVAT